MKKRKLKVGGIHDLTSLGNLFQPRIYIIYWTELKFLNFNLVYFHIEIKLYFELI